MSVDKTLFEIESSHSIYVNRLASKQVNDLNQFWFSYLNAMKAALEDYSPEMARRELNRLIASINTVITENMDVMSTQLLIDLGEFAEYEAQFQTKAIGAAAGESLALPATEQVIAAAIANPIDMGKAGAVSLKPWLQNLSEQQKRYVSGQIKLGYANGVTTSQMVTDLVGTKKNNYEDGVIDSSRRNAASLVRTSVNHYATTARRLVYEKNKSVVIGIRICSTLDKRTSGECRARDGQEFYFADKKPIKRPPYHIGCRTSDCPITKKGRNLTGERASKGGKIKDGKLIGDPKPISSATDYYEFLSKQPAQFQDEVLGKTIGKAFRNAGVSPSEFQKLALKAVGRPMTIDNVKKMDKRLFEYIESQK